MDNHQARQPLLTWAAEGATRRGEPQPGPFSHIPRAGSVQMGQAQSSGAMSTLTFIVDFFASVKMTPLTGVTSA